MEGGEAMDTGQAVESADDFLRAADLLAEPTGLQPERLRHRHASTSQA